MTNQDVISAWLKNFPYACESHVIFDGHLLIETVEGTILVPVDIFDGTSIQAVLFIEADFDLISDRREKLGLASTSLDIARLIDLERENAKISSLSSQFTISQLESQLLLRVPEYNDAFDLVGLFQYPIEYILF